MTEESGRSPASQGRAATASPPSPKTVSGIAGIPNAVWLIWATEGEYSDRSEWPIAVAMDQATGERITERLGQLWRELNLIYDSERDALEDANDWCGETLFETTEEGREYQRLTGVRGFLGGCYSDDRSFTCSEVRVLTASGIEGEAGDAEERLHPEGESPVGNAETPKSEPNDHQENRGCNG